MSDAKCYFYNPAVSRIVQNDLYHPCGPTGGGRHAACCQYGSYCMADGLCKYDVPADTIDSSASQYYIGACTDRKGNDPACTQQCRFSVSTYVTNLHGQVWQCCGDRFRGNVDCADPKGAKFFAVPESELSTSTLLVDASAVTSILNTAEPSSVKQLDPAQFSSYLENGGVTAAWFQALPTEVQTLIYTPSPSHNTSQNSGDGSSSSHLGVYVGVPVGVVGALIIIGIISFILLRRRRRSKQAHELPTDQSPPDTSQWDTKEAPYEKLPPAELSSTQTPVELPTSQNPAELPGDFQPAEADAVKSPRELPTSQEEDLAGTTLR